ncbi:MAG TPA: hypothetical protein VEH29_14650 [Acidimicrobiales bacterium]|nr:hypothetical protein [Acidimicrobiales bacterium]
MKSSAGREAAVASSPAGCRVYAAHPISCYGTAHARDRLATLGKLLGGVEIVDPEERSWPSEDAWFDEWPDLLASLDGLVVFAAPDGTIGTGCVTELADALASGILLAGLDDRGLRRLDGLRFVAAERRTMRSAARLFLGEPIAPDTFQQAMANGGNIRP